MLSKGVKVEAFSATRKHSIMEQAEKATGEAEFKWLNSCPVICNVVCGMMCGSKPLVRMV